ncbi:hypothetical protein [Lacrimispora sp.]|uniref:hypothetical protein n=1 Tax=Lacrimispora sp. TaxID=2719234 RepID=UPI0032E51B32
MKYEQFIKEITPSVNEIICECLKMTDEGYQEYKEDIMTGVVETNAPYILRLFQVIFDTIDKHRNSDNGKEKKIS